MKQIAVVYGAGSSFDSGYTVAINDSNDQGTPPPLDRGFFKNAVVRSKVNEKRYLALRMFITKYFWQDVSNECNLGLEEVWTAVDLNHKHVMLDTYDWQAETEEYWTALEKQGIFVEYPQDTEPHEGSGNVILGSKPLRPTRFKFLGDCGRNLKELVYAVYGKLSLIKERSHFDLLHKKISNHDAKVEYITFNYDRCLEDSLKKLGSRYNYFPLGHTPFARIFKHDSPHIIKLHGSLTWKYNPQKGWPIEMEPGECSVKPEYNITGQHYVEPVIIAPTIFKQEINDDARLRDPITATILQQWRAAIQILTEADRIIIVGYSFPATDFHVERLFRIARMKKAKPWSKAIYCGGCSDCNDVARRLQAMLGIPSNDILVTEGFSNLVKSNDLDTFLTG